MGLEKKFDKLVKDWKEHCNKPGVMVSSSMQSMRDCDAYKKIVQLSYKTLPLIRKLYDEDSSNDFVLSVVQGHGLLGAVREIIGDDFQIPEDMRGKILEMEDYTKKWLDENIPKYLKQKKEE